MSYQGQLRCEVPSEAVAGRRDGDRGGAPAGEMPEGTESAFRSLPCSTALTPPALAPPEASTRREASQPGPGEILSAVSLESGISLELLLSPRRERKIARPRQLAMYLIRRLCLDLSLARIGAFIGGRDHKTVMHACDLIDYLLTRDAGLRNLETRIYARLYGDPG